jgi:hypothetical protein
MFWGPWCKHESELDGTRLSVNKNSRTRRSHRFNLMQHLSQCGAISDDLFEVHLATQFPFEIKLLLCELVLEFRDLTIGQCVVNSDRYLAGNLGQEIYVGLGKSVLLQASEAKSTKHSITTAQWGSPSRSCSRL